MSFLLACAGCARNEPARPELRQLETPALDRLDPAVQEVLEQALDDLRARSADPGADPAALGLFYGDLGRLYHLYQLYDAAVPCYLNAQALLPEDHRWPYYLGQLGRSRYELDSALPAFERALELRPDDGPTLVAIGQVHREAGRLSEAEGFAQRALAVDDESGGALLLMAQLAVDRGDSESAVEWYERILELQPEATRMHQPLAMAYRSLGRLEEAQEHLAKRGNGPLAVHDPLMMELQELEARALRADQGGGAKFTRRDFAAGVSAFENGDFGSAAEIFRRAVDDDPGSVAARLNLGSALARLGRLDDAVEQYTEVLALEPGHGNAHFNLGVILTRLGRLEEGLDHYREALRGDPGFNAPRFNLANTLRQNGRCAEAAEHYVRLRETDPGNPGIRAGEVLCLIDLGQIEEARARLEESLLLLPENRMILQLCARSFAASPVDALRDGARALDLAQKLVASLRDVEGLEALAMAQAELRRFDEAVSTQHEAVALAESSGRREIMARLRANLERYEHGEPCRDPAFG